jgi:choline monooxygenase
VPNDTLDIAANLSEARTPPPEFYRSQAEYDRLRERVLTRSWSLLHGPKPGPGLTPTPLLPGSLDEPLVWTRDEAGALTLLSNVCTHRNAVMIDEACVAKHVACPYHGRRFGLDGQVSNVPGFPKDSPAYQDALTHVPNGHWGPLSFASLDPIHPLEALLTPVRERLGFLEGRLPEAPAEVRRYRRAAHWVAYVDNYLEGFHIPFVHPELAQAVDLAQYSVECLPWGTLQIAEAKAGEPALEPPAGHPDAGKRIAAWYFWLFPTTMLNVYPWGVSVNRVLPLGPSEMEVVFESWVWDAALRQTGAGAALDTVEQQDEDVVLRVARGVRSRLARRGRYSPQHERGVHHFHRLLMGLLG